ncbi:MAG: hypothetical protein AAGI10_00755 [Pseudomonadota bacterium]
MKSKNVFAVIGFVLCYVLPIGLQAQQYQEVTLKTGRPYAPTEVYRCQSSGFSGSVEARATASMNAWSKYSEGKDLKEIARNEKRVLDSIERQTGCRLQTVNFAKGSRTYQARVAGSGTTLTVTCYVETTEAERDARAAAALKYLASREPGARAARAPYDVGTPEWTAAGRAYFRDSKAVVRERYGCS